jgi:hypothetical protein
MKYYEGISNPRECDFEVSVVDGTEVRPLNPRLDLQNHSPTGLSWGYAGSGPAQCALAILADAVGDELAQKHYQRFKARVVAALPVSWTMPQQWVKEWVDTAEGAA